MSESGGRAVTATDPRCVNCGQPIKRWPKEGSVLMWNHTQSMLWACYTDRGGDTTVAQPAQEAAP